MDTLEHMTGQPFDSMGGKLLLTLSLARTMEEMLYPTPPKMKVLHQLANFFIKNILSKVSQMYLTSVTMFLAIGNGDAVDLDLRISQPNVHDSKRDNPLSSLQLTCDSPESSSTMASQVKLQDYTALRSSIFLYATFHLR